MDLHPRSAAACIGGPLIHKQWSAGCWLKAVLGHLVAGQQPWQPVNCTQDLHDVPMGDSNEHLGLLMFSVCAVTCTTLLRALSESTALME